MTIRQRRPGRLGVEPRHGAFRPDVVTPPDPLVELDGMAQARETQRPETAILTAMDQQAADAVQFIGHAVQRSGPVLGLQRPGIDGGRTGGKCRAHEAHPRTSRGDVSDPVPSSSIDGCASSSKFWTARPHLRRSSQARRRNPRPSATQARTVAPSSARRPMKPIASGRRPIPRHRAALGAPDADIVGPAVARRVVHGDEPRHGDRVAVARCRCGGRCRRSPRPAAAASRWSRRPPGTRAGSRDRR